VRFLVDEDFNNNLVRGLLRRNPGTDLVRVQDLGLRGAPDEAVLVRAASEGRVVLTHDVATLIACAYERVRRVARRDRARGTRGTARERGRRGTPGPSCPS
jgi:hypothetical protein